MHLWYSSFIRKLWVNSTVFQQRRIFKDNDTCVLWFTTPTMKEYKSLMQLVISILGRVTFDIQPSPQALTQWATTTATTMMALAMASVDLVAWAMATAPPVVLEAMVVMAVATSILLSMGDSHHLDSSVNTVHSFNIIVIKWFCSFFHYH